MPSPAEPGRAGSRRVLEGVAHGLALVLLAWMAVRAMGGPPPGPAERAGAKELGSALTRWSTVGRPSRVHLTADGDLSPAGLDWLAALARAGTPVTWDGGPAPVAATNDAVADPAGGSRVRASGEPGAPVALDDAYGPLDSLAAGRTGVTFLVHSGPSWVRARASVLAARAAVRDSVLFGRLLLLGRVSWESKFVAAALEERGWAVDARLGLSPKGDVVDGPPVRLDTSRYSAVIVLDSVAPADLAAIGPYLRAGGGAILTTQALRAPVLRSLGAPRAGTALPALEPFDTAGVEPRRSLALWPVADAPGQLTLESRGGQPAVVARRVERGRLLLLGYQDTWRWRMSGAGNAVERHRDWWAGLVAGVARVGRISRPVASNTDEAPLAHLLDRLGPPASAAVPTQAGLRVSNRVLFALVAGLLLLEWASRRLRGAS